MSVEVVNRDLYLVAIVLHVGRRSDDIHHLVHLRWRQLVDLGDERLLLLKSERVVRVFAVTALAAKPSEGKVAYM